MGECGVVLLAMCVVGGCGETRCGVVMLVVSSDCSGGESDVMLSVMCVVCCVMLLTVCGVCNVCGVVLSTMCVVDCC